MIGDLIHIDIQKNLPRRQPVEYVPFSGHFHLPPRFTVRVEYKDTEIIAPTDDPMTTIHELLEQLRADHPLLNRRRRKPQEDA